MVSPHDRHVLRELARRKAEIGRMPRQQESAERWRKLNALEPTRPLVWINEVCWHELNADGALSPQCADEALHGIERQLRFELYQWDHFPGDMVVEPVVYSGIVGGPQSSYGDYGIEEKAERVPGCVDVVYQPVIHTEADADRITTPRVWFDRDATRRRFELLSDIFDGVIDVRRRGITHQWHAAWDQIIHWYGVEQMYMDFIDKPDLVHRLLRNFFGALDEVLAQQVELGMLDVSNGNHRVGSGGMGISDQLPDAVDDGQPITHGMQWGCATAQILSDVSPDMHEEFALRYERPILERYGLTYYGCCEPLHDKVDMLRSVKNLRKISCSPKADPAAMAANVGEDFVISFKPNPAYLATDDFHDEQVRRYLTEALQAMRGCRVEVILKDISTIRRDPARLDRWAAIAMDVVQRM